MQIGHKTIKDFDELYVYDSRVVEPNSVHREKICVLSEVIADGATESTYIVKYPNGREAFVSKDMYCQSQDGADLKLLNELYKTKESLVSQIISLSYDIDKLSNVAEKLQKELKIKYLTDAIRAQQNEK